MRFFRRRPADNPHEPATIEDLAAIAARVISRGEVTGWVSDDASSARQLLVGQEVSTVAFVRNYVELHFDGPVVRTVTDPHGIVDGRSWSYPSSDDRDVAVMLGYIGRTVTSFDIVDGDAMTLGFDGATFTVPLDEESRVHSPEAVSVHDLNSSAEVRPTWMW